MFRFTSFLLAAAFAAGCITSSRADETAPAPQADKEQDFLSKTEREVLELTNKERIKAGLPPFVASQKLSQAAQAHAKAMAAKQMLAHTLDGKRFDERIEAAGYRFSAAGENIANTPTAKSSMNAWMNSAGHRQNILNPAYREAGFGHRTSPTGENYWVQVFARPLND